MGNGSFAYLHFELALRKINLESASGSKLSCVPNFHETIDLFLKRNTIGTVFQWPNHSYE